MGELRIGQWLRFAGIVLSVDFNGLAALYSFGCQANVKENHDVSMKAARNWDRACPRGRSPKG